MTNQPTESELKPCPFCGELPKETGVSSRDGSPIYWCACFTPHLGIGVRREQWNTRPAETELQSLRSEVERLRAFEDKVEETFNIRAQREGEMLNELGGEIEELRAQNAELVKALEAVLSDVKVPLDQYAKLGPQWTSRETGEEYYSANYVLAAMEELKSSIEQALAKTGGAK